MSGDGMGAGEGVGRAFLEGGCLGIWCMSEKGRFWLQRQLFTVHGVSMASMETFPRNYDTKGLVGI